MAVSQGRNHQQIGDFDSGVQFTHDLEIQQFGFDLLGRDTRIPLSDCDPTVGDGRAYDQERYCQGGE